MTSVKKLHEYANGFVNEKKELAFLKIEIDMLKQQIPQFVTDQNFEDIDKIRRSIRDKKELISSTKSKIEYHGKALFSMVGDRPLLLFLDHQYYVFIISPGGELFAFTYEYVKQNPTLCYLTDKQFEDIAAWVEAERQETAEEVKQ